MIQRRHWLAAAACSLLGSSAYARSQSQSPIKLVVPYAAGANSDVFTRALAQRVTELGGPVFVVENRPGGGGAIAAVAVKQAMPDGLTLLVANVGSHAILPAMQPLGYDPLHDFTPITQLFYFPNFLIVPARLPVDSVPDLLAWGQQQPQGLSYGSQGVGSPGHLLGAMLAHGAKGSQLVHVPYAAGGGPMNMDLLAGRLDMVFSTYASMRSYAEQGKVKFLAVASPQRSALLPQVPTLAEAGYPDIELESWFGLVAPAGTPPQAVASLQQWFMQAAQTYQLHQRFAEQGVSLAAEGAQALTQRMAHDRQRFGQLVQDGSISAA